MLASQGHPLIVTGRPTGVNLPLYTGFQRVELQPLTHEQQATIVAKRLSTCGHTAHKEALMSYIHEKLPPDVNGAAHPQPRHLCL